MFQVKNMRGWGITNLKMPMVNQHGDTLEAKIERNGMANVDNAIYWIAPLPYLGNKVGILVFVIVWNFIRVCEMLQFFSEFSN